MFFGYLREIPAGLRTVNPLESYLHCAAIINQAEHWDSERHQPIPGDLARESVGWECTALAARNRRYLVVEIAVCLNLM